MFRVLGEMSWVMQRWIRHRTWLQGIDSLVRDRDILFCLVKVLYHLFTILMNGKKWCITTFSFSFWDPCCPLLALSLGISLLLLCCHRPHYSVSSLLLLLKLLFLSVFYVLWLLYMLVFSWHLKTTRWPLGLLPVYSTRNNLISQSFPLSFLLDLVIRS